MWKNLTNRVLISPSVIAADLTTLGNLVGGFDESVVDLLHMDVMDGNFVPNLTFGPGYIRNLMQHTRIPLDVHLMIEKPEDSLDCYLELKPWCITLHYESTRFPIRLLTKIRQEKIIASISLNPATPIEVLYDILPYTDMVLVMSVDPGFYGQSFLEVSLDRIRRLHTYINATGLGSSVAIQVDGGITKENIKSVVDAGARIIVAGNAAFRGGNVNGNVQEMKDTLIAS